MDVLRYCVYYQKKELTIKAWNTPGISHAHFLNNQHLFHEVIALGCVAFNEKSQRLVLYDEQYFVHQEMQADQKLMQIKKHRQKLYPLITRYFQELLEKNNQLKQLLVPHSSQEMYHVYGTQCKQYE